jgi:DNA repair exonuclease SbcCD ATPase subunit
MDQELIAYLDTRFRETSEQIEGLREEFIGFREETSRGFERVDSAIRQTHVTIEGLRGEVRLLAEGVMGADEKLQTFRAEVKQEFEDTRSLIRSSYAQVDRRVHALESWRELKERDPLDLIREKYGKPPG